MPAPVPLGPQAAPAGEKPDGGDTRPALYPFLPPPDRGNGCAVLIVPGDGAKAGEADGEGAQMAEWLSDRGIAGFVLRYGTPTGRNTSVADVGRAMQYLRTHAADLRISPRRVGVLGFAAGAALAAAAGYDEAAGAAGSSAAGAGNVSRRPDFVALIWGSALPSGPLAGAPPTFLAGSAGAGDGPAGMIELWTKLRAAHVPVDAHFFAHADPASGLERGNVSPVTWPGIFATWVRFAGFLTDAPRLPVKGRVYLDGRVLPHGYVVFTPIDFVGAGPVVGRVFNSTAGAPLGEFFLPADQGPVAGRYKVDVRQNMNRWLSNSFSGDLVNVRGVPTPAQSSFGHYRQLAPSIDDQHSFTKVHPADRDDYIVEFKPDAEANMDLRIEVFSR
jgi:acetyl esterase/lipase